MAYLHSEREQFRDAIDLAYDQTGVMVQAIEKDYYVTMLLRLLAQKMPYIVFKGGTSLSKCHKVIRRFSEDIDITIDYPSVEVHRIRRLAGRAAGVSPARIVQSGIQK